MNAAGGDGTAVSLAASETGVAACCEVDSSAHAPEFTKLAADATYGCRRPHGYGLYDEVSNKTFVCWNGPGMSVMGRSYDHASQTWSPARELCHQEYYATWDYHNYPNMALAPDGHLIITWADHGADLRVIRSPQPNSMEGDWSYRVAGEDRNCYPMIMTVGERIYVFYSQTVDLKWPYRSFGYVYSDDSGLTWSDHIPTIDSQQLDPNRIDEVYGYHFSLEPAKGDEPDKIHFVWIMRGGPNGHNQGSRNVYFASFIPDSGTWRSLDQTDLGTLIDLEEMLAHCIVLDTGPIYEEKLVTRALCSWYSDGSPIVIYNKREECWIAVWNQDSGLWEHEYYQDTLAKDLERMDDGSHRLLTISPSSSVPHLLSIYQQGQKGADWTQQFQQAIPYEDGADRTWSMAFLDHSLPEVDILLSQLKKGEEQRDYSGRWPVWTVDTSGAE
ncbi:BNR-4 repeat-containing protein [Coraliomargarita sp. SDUM461004]|uniref:BNR-4 repeat-containing protein n=1 Tax=Thalassobacterium sedimentorum TaxID=3041258 RepID=A0ABU1AJI9_9BACT|nr:BNR-4 repeat-containing protein [Coraliomargarita sp. SDUM461004]MDQ8194328.1 BNR-4 repeat-containing protein [Coraliomargarita sp. SDUM461004]